MRRCDGTTAPSANNDSPVVWRGLMVMKAVQQVRRWLIALPLAAETHPYDPRRSSFSTWIGHRQREISMRS
jgi:hypothetical protein